MLCACEGGGGKGLILNEIYRTFLKLLVRCGRGKGQGIFPNATWEIPQSASEPGGHKGIFGHKA